MSRVHQPPPFFWQSKLTYVSQVQRSLITLREKIREKLINTYSLLSRGCSHGFFVRVQDQSRNRAIEFHPASGVIDFAIPAYLSLFEISTGTLRPLSILCERVAELTLAQSVPKKLSCICRLSARNEMEQALVLQEAEYGLGSCE